MRKFLKFIYIPAVAMTVFSACSKKSSSNTVSSPYYVKGTKNGVAFTTASAAMVTSPTSNITTIEGFNGNSSIVDHSTISTTSYPVYGFTFFDEDTVGTYAIDGFSVNAYISTALGAASVAAYGTVTITASDTSHIAGTFSYTCTDSTKITNGSFDAKTYH